MPQHLVVNKVQKWRLLALFWFTFPRAISESGSTQTRDVLVHPSDYTGRFPAKRTSPNVVENIPGTHFQLPALALRPTNSSRGKTCRLLWHVWGFRTVLRTQLENLSTLIGLLLLDFFCCRAAAVTVHRTPQSPDETYEDATDFSSFTVTSCARFFAFFRFFSGAGRKTSFARIKMALIYVLTVATVCTSVGVVYLHRWVDLMKNRW